MPASPRGKSLRCWQAVADFVPAPGRLYELPLTTGDQVAIVETGTQIPEGWLFVSHLSNGLQGLVPLSFMREVEGEVVPPAPLADAPSSSAAPLSGRASPGAAGSSSAQQPAQAESPDAPANKDHQRVAIAQFKPDAGAVYELPIEKGDLVELAIVDWTLPEGWLVAKNTRSGGLGLVPASCLAPLPKEANEPTLQELKEKAERGHREALADKDKLAKHLAENEAVLAEERRAKAQVEAEKAKNESELEKVSKEKEQLSTQVAALKEVETMQVAFQHVVKQIPMVKTMVDTNMAQTRRIDEAIDEAAAKEGVFVTAVPNADGEPSAEGAAAEGEGHVVIHSEEDEQKGELLDAERERARIARKIQQLDHERQKAIGQLTEAETRYVKAAKTITAKDEAAAAGERVRRLLPRVKELLAPTQDELTAYLEVMTSAVMKTAEESAVVLLETLARTNDPQQAIAQAFQQRAARRSGAAHQHVLEHRIGPRPMRRQPSLPTLSAARAPPSLPSAGPSAASLAETPQPTPQPVAARRPPPAAAKRPGRPSSANPLHNRLPTGRASEVRHRRMPIPDRLRRTLSWEPSVRPAPRLRPSSSSSSLHVVTPTKDAGVEKMFAEPSSEAKENLAKRSNHFYHMHIERLNRAREAKANALKTKLGDGVYTR